MTLVEMHEHALTQRVLAQRRICPHVVVANSRSCLTEAQASATASAQGWKISVAPELMLPSRITALGQANFIGRVCTGASL